MHQNRRLNQFAISYRVAYYYSCIIIFFSFFFLCFVFLLFLCVHSIMRVLSFRKQDPPSAFASSVASCYYSTIFFSSTCSSSISSALSSLFTFSYLFRFSFTFLLRHSFGCTCLRTPHWHIFIGQMKLPNMKLPPLTHTSSRSASLNRLANSIPNWRGSSIQSANASRVLLAPIWLSGVLSPIPCRGGMITSCIGSTYDIYWGLSACAGNAK